MVFPGLDYAFRVFAMVAVGREVLEIDLISCEGLLDLFRTLIAKYVQSGCTAIELELILEGGPCSSEITCLSILE